MYPIKRRKFSITEYVNVKILLASFCSSQNSQVTSCNLKTKFDFLKCLSIVLPFLLTIDSLLNLPMTYHERLPIDYWQKITNENKKAKANRSSSNIEDGVTDSVVKNWQFDVNCTMTN